MRIKQAYCSSALAYKLALEGEEEKRERQRKRSGERGRPGLLSPETSRAGGGRLWGAGASSEGPRPAEAAEEEEEEGQAALLWWRRVPEDTETLEAVRRVRGGREGKGRAAGQAEAAYQAVSCGDKQSPEVIGVHAACLLLLQDPGTAEEAGPRVGKRGRPVRTAGRQDSGGSRADRGGPERPGKGAGVRRDTGQGGGGKRAGEMVHNGEGWGGRGKGDREKEREREEQLMPRSAGAPGARTCRSFSTS